MFDAAALGGFASMLGGIFANEINRENVQDTNDMNYKIAKYGFEQQKEMIREQNLYNSPLQQLKRYEEAGLNPNLIYGEGKASAGNQSSIAQYHAPTYQAPSFEDVITPALQYSIARMNAGKEIEKKDQEIENLRAQNWILQEDAAEKQLSNFVRYNLFGVGDRYASGFDQNSRESLLSSTGFKGYSAAEQTKEIELQYRQALANFESLKVKEQQWINTNKLPLEQRYLELRNSGLSEENAILKIKSEYQQKLQEIGGKDGALLMWSIIKFLLSTAM